MKKHNIAQKGKRALSMLLVALMILSCWVWVEPGSLIQADAAVAADDPSRNHYLFAYFTGNSSAGQTIHLAVSEDGLHYTALRNNEPVIIPSKGTGAVRDPYLWYDEATEYYYVIATDMDASGGQWWGNSNGFIMWRSKDLVNWYDETFISVPDVLQSLNKNLGTVYRAWAPQILHDGTSYVVYFSIDTDVADPANDISIVYFRTSDLMDLSKYSEYGGIHYPGKNDVGFGVNDAEIVYNPKTEKWYLFYKPELGKDANGNDRTDIPVRIYMLESDNATGPYNSTVSDSKGINVFPNVNEALEGGNGYFDNDGSFVMYADAYLHGDTPYFYVSKTTDFKNWNVLNESSYDINSLSPRHGSVVKITTEEYNRLLNNTNSISSSSFPETEDLSSHLIARYFTTSDLTYNAANGKKDLAIYGNMTSSVANGYPQANFDGTDDYAQIDLETLSGGDFNYNDGFTITFTAKSTATTADPFGKNSRIYEIADVFASRTGTEHYTHFAVAGNNGGAYVGNYGPNTNNNGYGVEGIASKQYSDGLTHKYIVSYANGNTIVYCDGELIIKTNRFDGAGLDDAWYKAIRKATMLIGKSPWANDPLFQGYIQDLCIYDCSMSYYDVQAVQEEFIAELGWINSENYTGIQTKIPTFANANTSQMSNENNTWEKIKYVPSEHYSNILYTPQVTGTPSDSANPSMDNSAVYGALNNGEGGATLNFGIYYPTATVLLYDGITEAKMPIMMAGNIDDNDRAAYLNYVYPIEEGTTDTDNKDLELLHYWYGWTRTDKYHETVQNPDGSTYQIGYSSTKQTTEGWIQKSDGSAKAICYFANTLAVKDNIDFEGAYFKKYTLGWRVKGVIEDTPETIRTLTAHNGDIYVINFKPILEYRNTITQAEYNSIMNSVGVPQELKNKYAAAVYGIKTFDINRYDFSTNAADVTVDCANDIKELIDTYEAIKALVENPSEVRYENLFSFNGWVASESDSVFSGTISTNRLDGTITIVNQHSDEIFTRAQWDGSDLKLSRDKANYCIPVEGGKTYVVEATNLASSTSWGEIFIFQYNKEEKAFKAIPTTLALQSGETKAASFTVDQNAAFIELRFDCNDAGKTITFSDIGIYTKESYNNLGAHMKESRLAYIPGYGLEIPEPKEYGINFENWTLSDRATVVTSVDDLPTTETSTIIYASTIGTPPGYQVTFDSLFVFSAWVESSCNMLWYGDTADGGRLVKREGIVTDAEQGTITITRTANEAFARTNLWVDTGNRYFVPVEKNTNYVIEYTASSSDGAKANVCAYFGGSTFVESGAITRYSLGRQRVIANSGDYDKLYLRFDNANSTSESTITYSNIAVFRAESPANEFNLEAADSMPNREYFRYYDKSGENFGDVFDYVPERHGYVFAGWSADVTGDMYHDNYPCTTAGLGGVKVEQNWHVFSTWTENTYNIVYDLNGGNGTQPAQDNGVKYTKDVTLPNGADFTKLGYTFVGWSLDKNATSADYLPGRATNRLCGENGGTATLYAVWEAVNVNVTFDNLFDFSEFDIGGALTVNKKTDTGFTVTSTAGDGNTGLSYPIPVEPGKTYMVSADVDFEQVSGGGYDIYINTLDSNYAGETTAKPVSEGAHRESIYYISLTGQTTNKTPYIKFTAGANTKYIKIRFDANNAGNKLTVNNIRVCEDNGVTVSPANKYVGYNTKYGELPTPTKAGYGFDGWYNGTTKVTADTVMDTLKTVNLTSNWKANSYTIEIVTDGALGGTAPTNYNIEAGVTLPTSTKPGHTFKGWKVTPKDENNNWADDTVITNGKIPAGYYGDITLTAQWTANSYTIEFNGNGATSGSTASMSMTYDTAKNLTANGFTRDGYDFLGWSTSPTGEKVYNNQASVSKLSSTAGATVTLYAVWQINNSAIVEDNIVVDFGLPVEFDPVANDAILLKEIGNGSYTLGLNSSNSKFALSGKKITYTPSDVMNASETVEYSVTFGGKTLTSTITITPASNVYYEETFLKFADSNYIDWSSKGSKINNKYSIAENVYGYDGVYNNTNPFSNGTYLQANVRPDDSATTDVKENKSKSASFTFTGTGFDLISACGKNTGIQTVTVSKVNADGTETRVKNYLVDTYYATETMLQQVPIVSFRSLGVSETYIVRISASYLKSAAAVKAGSAQIALAAANGDNSTVINASTGKPSKAILDELEALGFDDGGKDIELIWMDEDSTFNGGTGGRLLMSGSLGAYFSNGTSETTQGLANYIDGFRVYKNGYVNNYSASEQNPTYYNVVGSFSNNFISYTADQFESVFGSKFDYADYSQTTGPKNEVYIEPGQAIAFKFKADATNGDKAYAMLGMRAVSGSANYKIITTQNSEKLTGTISTATEMYYDLSELATVDSNGELTILIANTTGTGALAVNNLKLVNGVQDVADQVDKVENNFILGGGSDAPLAPTPVVPEDAQGDAPETDVDTDTNVPENDTETDVEDETEINVSTMFPGMPASIASFLEMLFKFLSQLVSSLGF